MTPDYRTGGSTDRCEVIRVKGEGGAKSVKIPPQSSCLAMDVDEPLVYLIATDSTGFPAVEAYKIERVPTESEKAATAIETVTTTLGTVVEALKELTERMDRMEEQFK